MHISRISWWIKTWRKHCPYAITDFLLNFELISLSKSVAPSLCLLVPPTSGGAQVQCRRVFPRQPRSECLWRHTKELGKADLWAYEAEVKAILNALLFCQHFGFRRVIIESDSSLVVGWVASDQNRPWKLA